VGRKSAKANPNSDQQTKSGLSPNQREPDDTNDGKDNQPTPDETIRVLRTEVSTLQATIHDIQAWMLTKDNAIQKISQDTTMARESLQQTNIHELQDKLHLLKENVVQQEIYDQNRVRTDKDTKLERQRINKRLDGIDASTATNRLDYQDKITALKQNMDTSVETIETTLVLQFDELQDAMQAHLSTPTNR
jgi:hypothetical protein